MNILVTGANGQLGRSLRDLLEEQGTHRVHYTDVAGDDVEQLDITDAGAVDSHVKENGVECIINCAAYTNVDKAEEDKEAAELLNARAVGNLASAMHKADGMLIHISTDYVYDGLANTPIAEDAEAKPINEYGRTKLLGEEEIRRSGCKHIILRTAWLYSEHGRNFVKTMSRLLREKEEVNVVFDQVGTPTYARDLASAILQIISDEDVVAKQGIYHFSDEGVCSWYDVAARIAGLTGSKCSVKPCRSCDFKTSARRPAYSVLDKSKIKQTFGVSIPHWEASLERCLANLT